MPFSLDLIGRLLKAYPGAVKGVKDSSGDYANMKAMIDNFAGDGFEVYSGSDEYRADASWPMAAPAASPRRPTPTAIGAASSMRSAPGRKPMRPRQVLTATRKAADLACR